MAQRKKKPERPCGVRRSARNATRGVMMGSPNSSTESSPSASATEQPARGKKGTKGRKTAVDNSNIGKDVSPEEVIAFSLAEAAKAVENVQLEENNKVIGKAKVVESINDRESGNDELSANDKQKGNEKSGKEKSIDNANKVIEGDDEVVDRMSDTNDKQKGRENLGKEKSIDNAELEENDKGKGNDEVNEIDEYGRNSSSRKTTAVTAVDGRCVLGKKETTASAVVADSAVGGNSNPAKAIAVDGEKRDDKPGGNGGPPQAIAVDGKKAITTATVITDSLAGGNDDSTVPHGNGVQVYSQDTDDRNILEVTGSTLADLQLSLKVSTVMINFQNFSMKLLESREETDKFFKLSRLKQYNWNKIQSVVMLGLNDYKQNAFDLRVKITSECNQKLVNDENNLRSPLNSQNLPRMYNESCFGEREMEPDAFVRHVAYNDPDMFSDPSIIMLERGLKYHAKFDEGRVKNTREYGNYWKNYGKSIISFHPSVMQMNRYKWQLSSPRDMRHSKLARDFSTPVKDCDLVGTADLRYILKIKCDSAKNSSGKWTEWAYMDHHTTSANLRFVGVLHASKTFLHHVIIGYIKTQDGLKESKFSPAGGSMPEPRDFKTTVNPNWKAKDVISIRDGSGAWRAHQMPSADEASELYMGMHLLIDVMELIGNKYLETEEDYAMFVNKKANCEETEDGFVIATKRILSGQPFICLYRRPGIPKRAFKYSEDWARVPLEQSDDFVVEVTTHGRSVSRAVSRVNKENPASGKDDDDGDEGTESDGNEEEQKLKSGKKRQSILSDDDDGKIPTTGMTRNARKSPRKHHIKPATVEM